METLIRPWRQADFPAVRRILWESWIVAYRAFVPEEDLRAYFEATYRLDSLARLLTNSHIHGFIGEADGEAVGFARTQFHKNEARLYLASLYLLPAFQGKGIGGALLRAAEEKALAYELRELWVGVMVQNEAARGWYDRRGFRFVREEPFRMGRTTVPHLIGAKAIGEPGGEAAVERRVAAVYPSPDGSMPLAGMVAEFLERQRQVWPGLAEGYAGLAALRVREVRAGGWGVRVQFNPRRAASGAARLDPESIRRRPCFLCRDNLPREQQAILYRESYLVLCNPIPIFPGHLTIAHCRHLPQSIREQGEVFLRLAADLGPGMAVLYNGPRCGASAPDHLHFQAVPAGHLPVEAALGDPAHRAEAKERDGVLLWRAAGLGRGIIVIDGEGAADVTTAFGAVIGVLAGGAPGADEPLLNAVCSHDGSRWRLMVFPRRTHRPAAYHREGKGKLCVSPGVVEMGGVFVTHREEDFGALDPALVRAVYQEVAFDDAAVATLCADL